ncbi:MAG TPA: hypothetical protein VJ184_05550, partial [Chryseolinea sp.]|nr:hypothetical protein [Chryseolinea sp.]
SVTRILTLLSKDFTRLIVIAMFSATPLTWFFLQEWLQTFAYHIAMPWYFFGLSGLLTIAIALCTISFQAIRSALVNPIEAIKTE